ncbi:hypothetical protein Hanom_Chr12g01120571 [Helianthus anomalus]
MVIILVDSPPEATRLWTMKTFVNHVMVIIPVDSPPEATRILTLSMILLPYLMSMRMMCGMLGQPMVSMKP